MKHLFFIVFYLIVTINAQKLLILFLDGFRWDYIVNRDDLKGFKQMRKGGGYIKKVAPVFPADCHPNIYSIFTGLYPRHHGVLSNKVYNKDYNQEFDHSKSIHRYYIEKWVNAEPLWVTVKNNKRKSLIYHLPICEHSFGPLSPSICVPYSEDYMGLKNFNRSVVEAVELLKFGSADLAVVYNDKMDNLTHSYGPYSSHLKNYLLPFIDTLIQWIIRVIENTNIHLVVLSDHGMAKISREHQIMIESILLVSQIDHIINQGGYAAIWPKLGYFKEVYFRLVRNRLDNNGKFDNHYSVYTEKDIPRHWNVHGHHLSPPILMIAEPGYFISSNDLRYPQSEDAYGSGWHGYSPDHDDMNTLLLAYGQLIQPKSYLPQTNVTDTYHLLSTLLNITPLPHNGTLILSQTLIKSQSNINKPLTYDKSRNSAYFSSSASLICYNFSNTCNLILFQFLIWIILLIG